MKIVLERAALLAGIDRVRSVVSGRNTIPILSNVKLEASEDGLRLTATDLDMEASAMVDGTDLMGGEAGEITCSASMLYDLVRKMPDGSQVSLTYSGEDPRLRIAAGRSKFSLPVLPTVDFPVFDQTGLPDAVEMDAGYLRRLIDITSFAISSEETRYYLNGMYLHTVTVDGEMKMRAVATDGHRLALADAPLIEQVASSIGGGIIPRKAVREIAKLIDKADKASIAMGNRKIAVSVGGTIIVSKLIDGSFPDYNRVIPKDNPITATLDAEILRASVDRVATISKEKSRSLRLTFEDGSVALKVRNMEAGEANETVECEYDSAPMQVGLNARYLLDVLSKASGAEVEMRFAAGEAGAATPILVLDTSDKCVQFVIMPLRV